MSATATPGLHRRLGRGGVAALLFLLLLTVAAATGGHWLPFDPEEIDVEHILEAPGALHWFGTDELGRDVFARAVIGAQASLAVVGASVALAAAAGILLGLLAGYAGGVADMLIGRATDALMAVPSLVMVLGIVAVLGPNMANAILAIALAKTPGFVRVVRAEAIRLRGMDYVKAALALGASPARILRRYIWPNASGNLAVFTAIVASATLLTEASLSFLGLGVQPPTPSWGFMVATGMKYWTYWWLSVCPGVLLFLTVLAFNLIGDALRDAFDPRHVARH